MTKADWKGVCENFLMADGTFWPVPVCLDVTDEEAAGINVGDEIALFDPEGDEIMATMKGHRKMGHAPKRRNGNAKRFTWVKAPRPLRSSGRSPKRIIPEFRWS
jgi:ATP sulfurylase